jgi:hypothetical protein
MEGYANDPTLEILVDKMPDRSDLRYKKEGILYYAELDGYVSFFCYRGPGEGFGGRGFEITMEDGSQELLKGPFSSRAGVMNAAGFGPCVDVSITDNPESYERGYTFYAGHVTLKLIEDMKHIVEIGSGYHRKCGSGCVKEDEEFVEFPEGSVFTFFDQDDGSDVWYSPAVRFPNGKVWVKNVREKRSYSSSDLSADQNL